MQNLMPPINTPDQLFHDGDPTQGIEGTLVTAGYLNNQQGATRDLQQELLNVLGGAHIQPDPQKTDQLLTALRALLLSRKNPFGDIKLDGTVQKALENLGLGEGAPAIGVPFFWPSAAMPNTVIDSWSSMVFLKFNGAKFSATDYPVLAKVFPSLVLPEARGDFIRIWDDGRGVDSGRALLSAQSDDFKTHEHKILGLNGSGSNVVFGTVSNASPLYTSGVSQPAGSALPAFQNPGGTETRPRNIAFNFLVRAK
ncbi:integrase [Escherichia coli]|uniref:integrase n=1 Tax=Escherichia coli TaxID=562 RepID=UPI00378701B9